MSTIEIKNTGAVEELSIPLPEEGGVVVLTGPNGAGKDTSIEAIKSALGGKQRPTVRDGAKFGTVSIPGVDIRITSTVRKKGEAEVASVGGDMDYSEFVDPKLKSPAAADKARISLLCKIHGIKPDRSKFYELLGGEGAFNATASATTIKADSLVDMATSLKSDLEKKARECEDKAKVESGKAVACDEQIGDVNLDACSDSSILQAALEAALCDHTKLTQQCESADEAAQRLRQARVDLDNAREQYDGPSYADCQEAEAKATEAMNEAGDEVSRLEAELEAAKAAKATADANFKTAVEAANAASRHEKFVAECEQLLATSEAVTKPTDEQLETARQAVDNAREHLEYGVLVRKAKERKDAGTKCRGEATRQMKLAGQMRAFAGGALEVLAESTGAGTFFLEEDEKGNPRFMVKHPKRGPTYFTDLSDGEKWRFVFWDGIALLKRRGFEGTAIFPMEQRAWEGLDGANKAEVAAAAVEAKVAVITAQADQTLDKDGNVPGLHVENAGTK
jgi:hypothetical protein